MILRKYRQHYQYRKFNENHRKIIVIKKYRPPLPAPRTFRYICRALASRADLQVVSFISDLATWLTSSIRRKLLAIQILLRKIFHMKHWDVGLNINALNILF